MVGIVRGILIFTFDLKFTYAGQGGRRSFTGKSDYGLYLDLDVNLYYLSLDINGPIVVHFIAIFK